MKKKNILKKTYIELTGCIHNHSTYSFDSRTPVSKIIKAARKNQLDYITINDHLTMDAHKDKAVINEKDLIIIVGAEINDSQNNNHYLVFNTDKIITGRDSKEYVTAYKENGAIGFAAHPIESRSYKKFRTFLWTDKENDGFDGIEIWNFLSSWMCKINPFINGLVMVTFPQLFVRKPLRKLLNYWDELNNQGKRKAAIGSVDAHEEYLNKFGLKFRILKHNTLFKTIRTNVLLQEQSPVNDQSILQALKQGNSYIINYTYGYPYNFYAGIIDSNGESAIFGEEIPFSEGMKFYFKLPYNTKVSLFKNGKKIKSKYEENGFFNIHSRGNYRLEITRFGCGWIYTNNIFVV